MSTNEKVTDLGLIRVVSTDKRDKVYLVHNNLLAFSITCEPGRPSRFRVFKAFYTYDNEQWEKVFATYARWKRKMLPEFKLPHHSGRTLDGHKHPFRQQIFANKKPPESK